MALLASVSLFAASPVVGASSAASGGGAHKAVSADHGDCKNDNRGKHNGYDCPTADSGGDTSGDPIVLN
jgi:hypothetical protein